MLEYLGSVSKFSDFFNQLLEGVDSLHDLIAQNDVSVIVSNTYMTTTDSWYSSWKTISLSLGAG